ncbi:MAG: Gfo/Idh/MocA family oxidoreductase [Cytophagales bacterium]|nr:Gfo/Idh/MocA family oxidoreductase [Cytophagales bacterium]
MNIKFAVIGCGFWSHYQVAAWHEIEGVKLVAVCDINEDKAKALSLKFGNAKVYTDAKIMFENEKLDFVDIISSVDTHKQFVTLAAKYKINTICQKPMADNLQDALDMMQTVNQAGIKFYIHENFRWQAPIRRLKQLLDEQTIGTPFKASLRFCCSFPVFDNQPILKELPQFIIADLGVHILDMLRFYFGEVNTLYCKTMRVNPTIKGEDVANIFTEMKNGMHCYTELSYASIIEHERFPQTYILVEGTKGSIYLGLNGEIRTTTKQGTVSEIVKAKMYSWVDPAYDVAHASTVDTNANILKGLIGENEAETTGDDNIKTTKLVFAAYESASSGNIISMDKY